MKRILVGGYYGYGNIGDEAILEAFAQRILSFPDIEIKVLSSNRQYTISTQGLVRWSPAICSSREEAV